MAKKTMGEVSAKLLNALYSKGKMFLSIDDASKILRSSYNTAKKLLLDMTGRNLLVRIKSGKYIVVPEGVSGPYMGNWYVAAKEISNSSRYFVSHYSAMGVHKMLTQPLTKVYVSSPKRQVSPKNPRGRFRFIYVKSENIWGIEESWVTNTEKIRVSDIERTIIDCLWRPQYAGGITEIAKGIWIRKKYIDDNKLMRYVYKFNKNVVAKRLGFILETIEVGGGVLLKLKEFINKRYDILDPTSPIGKTFKNKWFLCANVSPDEIRNIIST